jgi:hypothetical protein
MEFPLSLRCDIGLGLWADAGVIEDSENIVIEWTHFILQNRHEL